MSHELYKGYRIEWGRADRFAHVYQPGMGLAMNEPVHNPTPGSRTALRQACIAAIEADIAQDG